MSDLDICFGRAFDRHGSNLDLFEDPKGKPTEPSFQVQNALQIWFELKIKLKKENTRLVDGSDQHISKVISLSVLLCIIFFLPQMQVMISI